MKVGIIGAGTMGSGIAQAFAQTEGYEVMLCDINETFAANGKKKIAAGFEKRIAKGKMTQEEADKILNKITTGVKDICGDCDLVVEAAIENMEIKKQTFKELDAICKPSCIFATNTSSLSITEIGGAVERHVIGMHFFNPAPVMKLVEVIAGLNTKPEDVEAVKKMPSREIVLQTVDGEYYHFKTDIFNREITYSTSKEFPANLVTIPASRAFEVISMNKRGNKPQVLDNRGTVKEEVKEFTDVVTYKFCQIQQERYIAN